MVVADASRKGPVLHGLPEGVLLLLFPPVPGHDSPLGAEEGLVGGAGDQVRPFGERLLEMGSHQPQDVGHVVEDDGLDLLLPEELPDLPDRFAVEDHALAEDDQLRPVFVDDPAGRLHVDLVGILRQDRKVHDGGLFRPRVDPDEIVEGAHRLGAQVAAPDHVVVQDRADPPGFRLPVAAVQIIDQGAEDHGIGHLAADHPGLDLPAAQVAGHLLLQQRPRRLR